MNIIVTGGCGYKGSVLVPKLLAAGHFVRVLDTMWFGNFLQEHKNLSVEQQDIREIDEISFDEIDTIIHLASIANDPAGDLNPKLTWEISALSTMRLCDKAVRSNVKRIIYASSGSVYGLKEEPEVTEDLPLKPLSEYNKTKMVAERVILSYSDVLGVQIVRPATVCGLSPRMRLDVAVNMLTFQGATTGKITVLGGTQTRPNIHIEDVTDLYLFLLERPHLTGIFNAGFENLSIMELAQKIQSKLGSDITVFESNDPRSYRMNSDKIRKHGFLPRRSVDDAINDLVGAIKAGHLKDDDRFHTLKWMKAQKLRD